MDNIDRKILIELQRDCTIAIAQLADKVGLSQTPCWKRVQKLEAAGIVTGRVAIVDPLKVGLGLTVMMEVEAFDHTEGWREGFLREVKSIPQVTEVLRLGGSTDYMLRIVVADMPSFDAIYRDLTSRVPMKAVTSKFVMETLVRKTVLPM